MDFLQKRANPYVTGPVIYSYNLSPKSSSFIYYLTWVLNRFINLRAHSAQSFAFCSLSLRVHWMHLQYLWSQNMQPFTETATHMSSGAQQLSEPPVFFWHWGGREGGGGGSGTTQQLINSTSHIHWIPRCTTSQEMAFLLWEKTTFFVNERSDCWLDKSELHLNVKSCAFSTHPSGWFHAKWAN